MTAVVWILLAIVSFQIGQLSQSFETDYKIFVTGALLAASTLTLSSILIFIVERLGSWFLDKPSY